MLSPSVQIAGQVPTPVGTLALASILPYLKEPLYDEDRVKKWVTLFDTIQPIPEPVPISEEDSSKITNDTLNYAFKVWDWHDFDGNWHSIKFKYKKEALDEAILNRETSLPDYTGYNYKQLYEHDRILLSDLIDKINFYKKNERKRIQIGINGKNKYFKIFNNRIVADYIFSKTLGVKPLYDHIWDK